MNKITSNNSIVSRILTEKRKELGLSQVELSTKIGITKSGWGKIEKGQSTISIDNYISSCEALKVSPSELFKEIEKASQELKDLGWEISPKKVEDDGLLWGEAMYSGLNKANLIAAVPMIGGAIASGIAAYNFLNKK